MDEAVDEHDATAEGRGQTARDQRALQQGKQLVGGCGRPGRGPDSAKRALVGRPLLGVRVARDSARSARSPRPGAWCPAVATAQLTPGPSRSRMSSSARCTFASLISTGPGVVKRVAVSWVNLVVGLIPPLKVPPRWAPAGCRSSVRERRPPLCRPRTRGREPRHRYGPRGCVDPDPSSAAHLVVIPQRPWDVSALAEASSPVRALSMSMIESATY